LFGFEPSDGVTFPHSGGVNYYVQDGMEYALSIPPGMDLSQLRDCTLVGSIKAVSHVMPIEINQCHHKVSFLFIFFQSASGTGFVFIVFAQAIATLPGSNFWAVLFFLMLLTLGIDSSFGTIEGALAALVDLQFKVKKWIITSKFALDPPPSSNEGTFVRFTLLVE